MEHSSTQETKILPMGHISYVTQATEIRPMRHISKVTKDITIALWDILVT